MTDNLRATFDFLRFCLNENQSLPHNIGTINWQELYSFAKKHSLTGVFFYGIQRLPQGVFTDIDLLAKWTVVAQKIQQKNLQVTMVADKVSRFFDKNGFRTCVLKGQGNALMYPTPWMRNPGDVDLYVSGGDAKVIAFTREHMHGSRACYHHIDVPAVDDVTVEIHYRPSFMQSLRNNQALQKFFERNMDLCCGNKKEVSINGTTCSFAVPSTQVNLVYQLAHQLVHFMIDGIGLRQMVDYYQLLMTAGNNDIDKLVLRKDLQACGLYDYAGAVMYALHELLGLPQDRMIAPMNVPFGRFFLKEVLLAGNFGRDDERISEWERNTKLGKNWLRIKRDFTLFRYLPAETIGEPIFRLYHYFWRVKHN